MATKKRKKTASKAKSKVKIETIEIPFRRAADFKYIFSDGALVRSDEAFVDFTFYLRDREVVSDTIVISEGDDGQSDVRSTGLIEENVNTMLAKVRTSPEKALQIAQLIVQQVSASRPDLVIIEDGSVKISEAIHG